MNEMNVPFSMEAVEVFLQAVSVMIKGMFGIFAFMIVFYLLVKVLDRVGAGNSE